MSWVGRVVGGDEVNRRDDEYVLPFFDLAFPYRLLVRVDEGKEVLRSMISAGTESVLSKELTVFHVPCLV